ncbi:hypothetical protein [Shewanella fidelis]|uniref:MSHA biogenesis protein MshF n=1 Tax=Shewanella fidelis TaxID=173509 RepID=A0AAW8NHZ0_9GAMM|nr:hypothetical protein [Shewanella fidelis]MDR8522156.1 hypothetical protein [Shewanella fidelis]MDW4812629.1 hypothetical protein [Shewanella fidelis]MDW4816377.1 hypothetical protein [Shewanella fidelis]MDW4820870.1 hypothetical protein [Shewanella fidelis]MDW4825093.1 hypothetical protein [Shewanella fidelis]
MLSQQKSDRELLSLSGKVFSIIILLLVLSYLAFSHFDGIKLLGNSNIQNVHNKMLNVLAGVKSQWLIRGQPTQLKLDWRTDLNQDTIQVSYVLMSKGGWPVPNETNVAGCRQLIGSLLGDSYTQHFVTELDINTETCRYIGVDGGSISYQLNSGRVIFLTAK